MPNTEHAIVVDRLCKRYGSVLAVDDISFTVNKGEVFAFLGPNGAGKSTTVEIIETIRGADVGQGHRARDGRPQAEGRGRPPDRRAAAGTSARSTGSPCAKACGTTPRCSDASADIDALMDLTQLRSKADARFNTLSGGLKQRLGIAAALVNDPEIVFLDEPTTGLDPHARRQVWDVLKGLKDRGKTVFLTTHYMEEAELLADTVAIISKGRIVAIDTPARLTETRCRPDAAHARVRRRGSARRDPEAGLQPHANRRRRHLRSRQER